MLWRGRIVAGLGGALGVGFGCEPSKVGFGCEPSKTERDSSYGIVGGASSVREATL